MTAIAFCPHCRRELEYTVPSLVTPDVERCPYCLNGTKKLGPYQTPVIGTPLPGKQEAA